MKGGLWPLLKHEVCFLCSQKHKPIFPAQYMPLA